MMIITLTVILLLLTTTFATLTYEPVALTVNNQFVTLSNGFVQLQINLASPSIEFLSGNLQGLANFTTPNSLSSPIVLEREDASGNVCTSTSPTQYRIITNTSTLITIEMTVKDCDDSPIVTENWLLSLTPKSRSFTMNVTGTTTGTESPTPIHAVRRRVPMNSPSIYSFFDRGVVQMMNANDPAYFAQDNLQRVYGLGTGTSIDMTFETSSEFLSNVLLSEKGKVEHQQIIVGKMAVQNRWFSGTWLPTTISTTMRYTSNIQITPNNYNFPAGSLTTGENVPIDDLVATMVGMYASSPGNLCTFDSEVVAKKRVAQIATTIASPGRGYQDTYNYFDPDNFIALSSMLYTGDRYLQQQAKDVIMRSGAFLNATTGQLPHHFNKDQPTFLALSGATQTGPNIFWTKTAIQYAKTTGDLNWLKSYLPVLRNASNFCFNLINQDVHMIVAPGSLMIDVFIRANFTSDSNAMMVGFMKDFAEVERAVGSVDIANALDKKSKDMATAMNKWLWDTVDNDHYVTQLDTDMETKRDFIDYDSNLIALAHNVPTTAEQRQAILNRIDSGSCSANSGGGPQWVSEIYYGKNDTTGGNVGDSRCSMGRIAWFDAHARKLINTNSSLKQFNMNLLLLQKDLIKNTWMHERYGCDGHQQLNRTMFYFEYPSTIVMLLREIRYGININLQTIVINPFGPTSFTYNIGDIYVKYIQLTLVEMNLPGGPNRGSVTYNVHGMNSMKSYNIMINGTKSGIVKASENGVITFKGITGCLVTATVDSSTI
jgi:hypothetical protein